MCSSFYSFRKNAIKDYSSYTMCDKYLSDNINYRLLQWNQRQTQWNQRQLKMWRNMFKKSKPNRHLQLLQGYRSVAKPRSEWTPDERGRGNGEKVEVVCFIFKRLPYISMLSWLFSLILGCKNHCLEGGSVTKVNIMR